MALQIRRGTDSQRQGITPAEGELIYTTDTDKLYIGDGSTAGGIEVSGGVDSAAISAIISASSINAAQLDGQNPLISKGFAQCLEVLIDPQNRICLEI